VGVEVLACKVVPDGILCDTYGASDLAWVLSAGSEPKDTHDFVRVDHLASHAGELLIAWNRELIWGGGYDGR
jgi:hypothetical protein